MRPVTILGLGADGLAGISPRARAAFDEATFLAGGRRHLELVGPTAAETFTITADLESLERRLLRRGVHEHCVVLASGDPLFYGIGRRLLGALGGEAVVVEPALSSVQLAFARVPSAWDDAVIASVHGRPLAETLRPLLGHPKIGLFTQDGGSPAAVASFFLERGLPDYRAWVCEDLGADDERVTRLALPDLSGLRRFSDLNFLILLRPSSIGIANCATVQPLPDAAYATPPEGPQLLTHQDIRALVLARFGDIPPGPLWDIGSGLGGVSMDLARSYPEREVVAVERSPEQIRYLRENRLRFAAYNLRIVEGPAPAALEAEAEVPAGVFLGGSGGRLGPILDLVLDRLRQSGVLVANFVGLENLVQCLGRLKSAGWPVDTTQVQISPAEPLAGLTTFVPRRPVWIVRASRPDAGDPS